MPRKHAANAAGHEMPPVASNRPAPTAATSSNKNVARKNPAAFAKGIHSATADGESGRASGLKNKPPPWQLPPGGWGGGARRRSLVGFANPRFHTRPRSTRGDG